MAEKKPPKIDINQASRKDLVSVNGIGDSLASRIIDYRPFTAVKDLVRVPGISETKLAALLPYLKAQSFSKVTKSDTPANNQPSSGLGHTEAFVFLEEPSDRQDALLIIFGGFILGLLILMFRRRN